MAALALGGCAVKATPPAGATGTPATSPAASAGTVPAALRGTYTADIEGTTATSGVWTLTITETDVLITNPNSSEPFSVDPHEVTATTMTLVPAPDCPDQSVATVGQYAIKLEGDKLTFTAVQDSCGDRKAVLSTATWTRKP